MDDLISRQEAIDRLSEVLSSEGEFEKAKQAILEAPIAYNMDKVVEENKQMKEVIYKASEELQKIIDYPHGIISCVQFFPKLREIQDELVGILEDGQVE